MAIFGLGRPEHGSVGALRAWNDDEFAPGPGFPMHRHQDVEILTYVRRGAITHEDSLGNRSTVLAGDVQAMRAGSGIRHAEFNHPSETTAVYQIWLRPRTTGGACLAPPCAAVSDETLLTITALDDTEIVLAELE